MPVVRAGAGAGAEGADGADADVDVDESATEASPDLLFFLGFLLFFPMLNTVSTTNCPTQSHRDPTTSSNTSETATGSNDRREIKIHFARALMMPPKIARATLSTELSYFELSHNDVRRLHKFAFVA